MRSHTSANETERELIGKSAKSLNNIVGCEIREIRIGERLNRQFMVLPLPDVAANPAKEFYHIHLTP